jgi:hypothetical protein
MKSKYLILLLLPILVLSGCVYDPIDNDMDINGILTVDEINYLYYDEISVPANAMGVLLGEAPTESNFQSGFVYFFADEAIPANERTVHFTVTMPHDYKEGTNVAFNVRWAFRNDEVGTNVRWRLSTSWANIGEAYPVPTNAWALSAPSNNDNSIYQRTIFAPTDGTGKDISSQILCYLRRNSTDVSDNYTDVAVLLSVGVLYQKDSPGSINQWTK